MVDVNSYYKKILKWITTTTPIGIAVIVVYGLAAIPILSDSLEVIGWALITGVGASVFFILLHYRYIHKELMRVDKYFRGEGESGSEMLRLLLGFPLKQPTIGFAIWAFCGGLAALGSAIPSRGALATVDMFLLWVGVLLGACTIWIFQFFQFRVILAPLAQEIVKKEPAILEKSGTEIPQFSLKYSQLITMAVPLVVSLLFAIISGYKQASFNLQTWIGKSLVDEVSSIADTIENLDLSNPGNLEIARSSLTPYLAPGTKMLYLVDSSQPKLDLLSGNASPFNPVSLGIIQSISAKNREKNGFSFDLYNNSIICFKQVGALAEGKTQGNIFLVASYPWKNYQSHLKRLVYFSLIIFLLFGGLTTIVAVSVARNLSNPLLDLTKASQRVAKGELREEIYYTSNDELGALAYNFRKMSESLKLIISRINIATGSLGTAMTDIEQASKVVNNGAQAQEHSVEEVFAAMMEMNTTIQGISENVETLSLAAQESSSSIFEVATSMKNIFGSIETLDKSIGDTGSSVSQMITAIDMVAGNVNNLSAIADETASSMAEMNAAIRQIEGLANETAGISEKVIMDAEQGVQAVDSTRQGIHKVEKLVNHAEEVITKLGKRGVEIGKIVQVIEEVTSQTNLLALNAAIIAAQAGEHGRGFSVVADEIKQLAERTAGSTREISQLIRAVQKESTEAVSAIQEGTRSVADSVQLSDQARTALDKILESSRSSTDRVREIARTTLEQASSSQLISKAMENMADMVSQISVATAEQSKGGSLIVRAAEQMKESSKLVHKSTEQQMEGSRLISKSIENITDMLYSINSAQKEQRKAAEQVVRLMEGIRQTSQESVESGSRLEQVFKRLEEEAGRLKQEVSHFRT